MVPVLIFCGTLFAGTLLAVQPASGLRNCGVHSTAPLHFDAPFNHRRCRAQNIIEEKMKNCKPSCPRKARRLPVQLAASPESHGREEREEKHKSDAPWPWLFANFPKLMNLGDKDKNSRNNSTNMLPNAAMIYVPGPKSTDFIRSTQSLDKQLIAPIDNGQSSTPPNSSNTPWWAVLSKSWEVVSNAVAGSPTDDLSVLLPQMTCLSCFLRQC